MKLLLLFLSLPLLGFGQEYYSARLDSNYALHLVTTGKDTVMLVQADTTTVVALCHEFDLNTLLKGEPQFFASLKYMRRPGAPHNQFSKLSRVGYGKDKYGHYVLFICRNPVRDNRLIEIVQELLPEVTSFIEIDSGPRAFLYVCTPGDDHFVEIGYPSKEVPLYSRKALCFYKPR